MEPEGSQPMSTDLEKAESHEIFRVERAGDLLIVIPVGDKIEFGNTMFQAEFGRVKALATRPEFRNVLVDLSNAAYFGSEMIGALIDLRKSVASSAGHRLLEDGSGGGSVLDGGVTALCGLSPDMKAGLRIMNVDTLLLTFDDRSQAVRTLAHQSVSDRVNQLGLPWGTINAIAGLALLIALFVFTPLGAYLTQTSVTDDFETVASVYQRWEERRNKAMTPEDRIRIGRPLVDELESLRRSIDKQSPMESRLEVARAARELIGWIDNPNGRSAQASFVSQMNIAQKAIEKQTGQAPQMPEGIPLKSSSAEPAASKPSSSATSPKNGAEAPASEPSKPKSGEVDTDASGNEMTDSETSREPASDQSDPEGVDSTSEPEAPAN